MSPRTSCIAALAVATVMSGCFAGGGMNVGGAPAPPPPPSMAPQSSASDGRWELARPGEPTLVLDIRGDVIVIERGEAGATPEVLARQGGAGTFEAAASEDEVRADVAAGASCVEVVAVEADELVVRIGKMIDDRCVLSDETLRLARQTQR
ncbi:MAG: hypothetical protein IT385_16385 [Deltaproteobacteria bacterium]|nr:hypothetical protein [Deltaproteobacteria bacterium]